MKEKFMLTESQIEFIAGERLLDGTGKHEEEAWRILGAALGFNPKTVEITSLLRGFYAEPTKRNPEPAPLDVEDWKDQIGGPGS